MPRPARGRGALHVAAVVGEGTGLVAVVHAGDREDRDLEARIVGGARVVRVPVRIAVRVAQPLLEDRRGVADDAIEHPKRRARLVPAPVRRQPEGVVGEDRRLRRLAADEGEPLDVVGGEHVVGGGTIDASDGGGDRHDRREVRRVVASGRPLVVARVAAAPHRYLAIAVGLARQPLDHVVAVVRFLDQRTELAFRIAPPAHVDGQERQPVRGEVHAAVVVRLADVGRQREDARCRRRAARRAVHRRVQLDAIAQRDLDAPLERDLRGVGERLRRRGRDDRRLRERGDDSCDECQNPALHDESLATARY